MSIRNAFHTLLVAFGLLKKQSKVLYVGLDNSGKSTIIQHFKGIDGSKSDIIPTVGFTVETFETNRVTFTAFDMSGQGKYRNLWKHYYSEADAIVFVVDASDRERMAVARQELEILLDNNVCKTRLMPILFLANKMDLPGVLTPVECTEALGLVRIRDRAWTISACNALTGDGLEYAIEWLTNTLNDKS